MDKKYEIIGEKTVVGNKTLYRIRALKDFGEVKKGDLGGYVENGTNLSHDGNCWIFDNARVFNDAQVSGNAKVLGNAEVHEFAKVFGDAKVYGDTEISGYAVICSNPKVHGSSKISGTAKIHGNSEIYGNAEVYGDADIYGHARVLGNSKVFRRAEVSGISRIAGESSIEKTSDYICIGPVGSRNDFTTFSKTKDENIHVVTGCFSGSLEKFKEQVDKVHGNDQHGEDYRNVIQFAEKKLS